MNAFAAALIVAIGCGATEEAPADADQEIWSFEDGRGRHVYVNGLGRVPPEKQASARRVDLSGVSTNPELGGDLDRALEKEWARLSTSGPCLQARAASGEGFFPALAREQGHLLLPVAAIAVLLFLTPWMMRRLEPPVWSRVLLVSIPALALVALFAHAIVSTRANVRDLRRVADACDPDALGGVPDGPGATAKRLGLVEQLRQYTESIDAATGRSPRNTSVPGGFGE